MKNRSLSLAASVLLCCLSGIQAREAQFFSPTNPTSFISAGSGSKISFGINALYGTHRNGIGAEGTVLAYTPFPVFRNIIHTLASDAPELPESVGLSARLGAMHFDRYFGIPGASETAEAHLKALYSIGEANSLFQKYPSIFGNGRHNLSVGLNGYLSTDGTSQVTGQLDYLYVKDKNAFMMNYENDTFKPWPADEYRTAAFRLAYLRDTGANMAGVGWGFNLWAGHREFDAAEIWNGGNIKIPGEVSRGETVTLYRAKEYSVDVMYLSFILNDLSLSFGWDSEIFKKYIHNNIHWVLDDGNLPLLDRGDRFFIEFKIGLQDGLF